MGVTRRELAGVLAGTAAAGTALAAGTAHAQEGSTWAAIRQRGAVRVGATPAEPWYYKDPQSNQWSGLGIGMANEIAAAMNVKVEVVETAWANAPAALQANQIDFMFVLDPTPQRALAIDFPFTPLLFYALAVLHRDKLEVKSWDDLNKPDINIGVTLGTSIDREVTARLPKAKIARFPNNDETVASFQSGRSDVVSLFHPALTMLQRRVGQGKLTIPAPSVQAASSVGVRREADKTWRDYLTTVLSFYYTTGRTQEIYTEFLKSRGIDPASVPGITRETWRL
jgi:polar amino acid transport system substrate-binding protein